MRSIIIQKVGMRSIAILNQNLVYVYHTESALQTQASHNSFFIMLLQTGLYPVCKSIIIKLCEA